MAGFAIYPAIDLRQGQVVRLAQGDPDRQKVYAAHPAQVARRWLEAGARWLHVVNLDGAFEDPDQANRRALAEILAMVRATAPASRVQFGGGLRSLEAVLASLEAGVSRVVLGTAAVQSPELVEQVLARCGPERVAVGLDARQGQVRLRGWTEASVLEARDLACQFASMGLRTVVFTDIDRDGVEAGVNIPASRALAEASRLEVIASGGVRGLGDIRRAQQAGLGGVIVGRALYEGTLELEKALQLERI